MLGTLILMTYLVRPGDTMSGVAAANNISLAAVEQANAATNPNPNLIIAGQKLILPFNGDQGSEEPSAESPANPVVTPANPVVTPAESPGSSQSGGSYQASPGSFQACVIQRESGGNPNAVNPSSGAGGLYQFTPSTWASLGYSGSPQNAPVSEQNAAFQKLYAEAGTSPWAPSDGC